MTDVFISYARDDDLRSRQVAQALRDCGYDVWRDDELPAHRAYSEVIEERLNSADAVVVLWSQAAARSQWVRAEADSARGSGTLVQARLDETIPPMPFNQVQCADLRDWDGASTTPGWNKLMSSVEALSGRRTGHAPVPPHIRQRSICILPFANMSGDAEQEYFSDGISEDITTDLSKVSALSVTARTTAFTFKGKSVDVGEVARKLGVSHVLEGSVRKAGNRIRITAQLIDGSTGDHLWAERYDRELDDIFAIQDEISEAIVDSLKLRLLPGEKKAIEQRGTNSVEAYNLYLMARKFWQTGNWGDERQIELVERVCRKALEVDPGYAKVLGLLAIAQCVHQHTFVNVEGDYGMSSAKRALEIDERIAEAHCVLARNAFENGDIENADRELEIALSLDAESWEVNREAARIRYFQRRLEDARRYYEKATELSDEDFHSWAMLASIYQALGDESAMRHAGEMMIHKAERVVTQDPGNSTALGIGAGGLAIIGDFDRMRNWMDRALLIDADNLVLRYNFACISANQTGDKDKAIELLKPVFDKTPTRLIRNLLTDPDLDTLRSDPRFREMEEHLRKRIDALPGPYLTDRPNRA